MMITLTPHNHVHFKVDADPGVMLELRDLFTFDVPGARFMPAFRNKMWDGKIRLLNPLDKKLYVGLKARLMEYADAMGYSVNDTLGPPGCPQYTPDTFTKFITTLPLSDAKGPIQPRTYQVQAVEHAISVGRGLIISPTASGKSLMLYLMMRWHLNQGRRQILIVPTQSLVEQMYSDFAEYSLEDPSFDVEQSCQRIYDAYEKVVTKDVVITTWQSIFKAPKEFFSPFSVLYGDEAHGFKATALTGILEKTGNIPYKIGTTGTLDGTKTHEFVLEGLFGAQYKATSTKTLMEAEQISTLSIQCIVLSHPEATRKRLKNCLYEDEIQFLCADETRNRLIRNLAIRSTGNTLILFQRVEDHGQKLYDLIREKAGDRPVYFIHGKVPVKVREQVRQTVETQRNAIIVASYGVYSTGVNIKQLHNLIFASPSKSKIRNLQSIGRGLRRAEDKTQVTLYDIADDLSWKSKKNHTLNHFLTRLEIYGSEEFPYTLHKVSIE
jgi:superfamily II DNA or RNA helicase